MESVASSMSDSADISTESEMESLARETDVPVEIVNEIYHRERAKIERTARIKTYVPVLTHRHVKELLRERRVSS